MGNLLVYNVIIFFAALVGGLLPLVRSWSERVLHLFVAAATGVFIGVTFIHMLPEFAELHPSRGAWSLLGISVVLLFAIERIGLSSKRDSGGGHAVLGYVTFIGLGLHSLAAGYSLGLGSELPRLQRILFFAILAHKSVEAFSLTTVLILARRSRRTIAALIFLLALTLPVGTVIGRAVLAGFEAPTIALPMSISTGTFIYVSLCDLLPEVFHHREDAFLKLFIIVGGLVASMMLSVH